MNALQLPLPCTGGVIEYIPYSVNGWIGSLTVCILKSPDAILLVLTLAICLLLSTILVYACLSSMKAGCKQRGSRSFENFPLESPTNSLIKLNDSKTILQTPKCLTNKRQLIEFLRFPLKKIVIDKSNKLPSFIKLNPFIQRYTRLPIEIPSIADQKNPSFHKTAVRFFNNFEPQLDKIGNSMLSSTLFELKQSRAVCSSSNLKSIKSKISFKSCIPSLNFKILPILLCLMGILLLVLATGYTCLGSHKIELTSIGLSKYVTNLSYSSKLLLNTWISDAYSIVINVIKTDVQNHKASSLRPFIDKMKVNFAEKIFSLNEFAEKNSQIDYTTKIKSQLHNFDTLLKHLVALFSVAPQLANGEINSILQRHYSYKEEIARLSTHPLLVMSKYDISESNMWQLNPVLNMTANILCSKYLLFPNQFFPSCNAIKKHLNNISMKSNSWPYVERRGDLNTVTSYMRVPQLLGGEKYVQQWLPLAGDPPAGIPFLFDTFVIREIDRGLLIINQTLDNFPSYIPEKVWVYANYVGRFPGVLAGILTFQTAIIVILSIGFVFQRNNLKHPNEKKMQICVKSVFVFFGYISIVCCIFGSITAWVGAFGYNQLCLFLVNQLKTSTTDKWLYYIIKNHILTMPDLHNFTAIQNINISSPYPLLSVINSKYFATSKPLLAAINMNRPANLSAILFSSWLNQTFYKLWYNDVMPNMKREQLSTKLPNVKLVHAFSEVRKALQLDATFDDLQVYNASHYLPPPSVDYYTVLAHALDVVAKAQLNSKVPPVIVKETERLSNYYSIVGNLVAQYKSDFNNVHLALKIINANKNILKLLEPLIKIAEDAMDYLVTKSDNELVSIFTNITAQLWIESRQPIDEYIIPLIYCILDQLVPYADLQPTYELAISPFCDPQNGNNTFYPKAPLFEGLRNFGFSVCFSGGLLLLFCTTRLIWMHLLQN